MPSTRPGDHDDETVWTGRRMSVARAVAGRRLPTASYRATREWLYWTAARPGAKPDRAPLWAVRDTEVRQSVTQRTRRVGDVVVSLQHRDYAGTPTFVVLRDVERPRDAARVLSTAAQDARRRHDG